MRKKKIKYGEIVKGIFYYFANAIAQTYEIGSRRKPDIFTFLDWLVEDINKYLNKKIEKNTLSRTIKRLAKRDILYLEEDKDRVKVYLKDFNQPKILEYSIKALLDFKKKKNKWKGKWYMVFFDVPEDQRNKREYLRKFLKRLGFYPYQKSVYIFPFACEKEVALIKKITQSEKYLSYAIVEKIDQEKRIKSFFKL